MNAITPLDQGIYLLPLISNAKPNRVAGYLIRASKTVLIETGSSPSNAVILSAFDRLGITPDQIDAIMVTHIHLDHAGGAGMLMRQCPNAQLLVHPNGKKHLCNPERLIEGARQVYGAEFDSLFDPIIPIPEDRVTPVTTGDHLDLGSGREIRFYETFGHARHHIIAFDNQSRGIFTGDMAGTFEDRIYERTGRAFCFPNTAPSQFDPEEMTASYELMISLRPAALYFTHFGKAVSAVELLESAMTWIPFFSGECIEFYRQDPSLEKLTDFIQQKMLACIEREGVSIDSIDRAILAFDNRLNAQGIVAYIQRLQKMKEKRQARV